MVAASAVLFLFGMFGVAAAFAPGRASDEPAATVTVTSPYWHKRFLGMRHIAYVRLVAHRKIRRSLLARPSVREAIELAGATYGQTALLWSLARCESHLWPLAQNASGSSGLLQFMPSTFASTPYGRMSIWSPYANAMAGGWMLAHGRRGEWVC